jgi:hypothetical protein
VPEYLLEIWQYEGRQRQFSDEFQGYAIFMSHDNADRAASLQFGRLLGKAPQARGLQYTPHYALPLMGNRRRQLIDAAAGVYRYDQLIVLRNTRMPALLLEAGSIVNRQEELELASPERRELISAAVVSAVEDFCAAWSRRSRQRLGVPRTLTPRCGPAMPIPRLPRVIPSPVSNELSHKNFLYSGINRGWNFQRPRRRRGARRRLRERSRAGGV